MSKTKAEVAYWNVMGDVFQHQPIPDIYSMPIEDIREDFTEAVVVEILCRMGYSARKSARVTRLYTGMNVRNRMNKILRMEGLSS